MTESTTRSAAARVRVALDPDEKSPFSSFRIAGGAITASSAGIVLSAPFPWPGEAYPVGGEFEAIVSRAGAEPRFLAGDGFLTITGGRFKGVVRTLRPDAWWSVDEPDDAGSASLPPDALDRLSAIEKFIADESAAPWMNCLVLRPGRAYALGNSGNIFATTTAPDFGGEALLPRRALSVVSKIDPPPVAAKIVEDRAMEFFWADGSWMRSQLVEGKVPERIVKLGEQAEAGEAAFQLSEEWKEAFDRVASFAKERVRVYGDRIKSARGAGEVEDFAESPVPEGKTFSEWPVDLARLVVSNATRWDLTSHPAPFAGPRVRGLIVGFRSAE